VVGAPADCYPVHDRALLDIPIELLDVVVTNRMAAGHTLAELAIRESARGVFLRKLVRSGEEMPRRSR